MVGPTLDIWMTIIENYPYSESCGHNVKVRRLVLDVSFFRLAYATPRSGGLPHAL